MSKIDELLEISQALPEPYRLEETSLRSFLLEVDNSWANPRVGLARKLKVRNGVLARLSHQLGHKFEDEDLTRFLPPLQWRRVLASDLQDENIKASFEKAVSVWIDLNEAMALNHQAIAEYQTFVSEFVNGNWMFWLNPSDFPEREDLESFPSLDRSTESALFSIVGTGISPEMALLIYAGLLSGSVVQPRTSAEWQTAENWVLAGANSLNSYSDFYSARAWLHSKNSPIHMLLDESSYKQLMTWFYSRTANFPTFSSIDLQLHEARRNSPDDFKTDDVFPGLVIDSIKNRRVGKAATIQSQNFVEKDTAAYLAELDALEGLEEIKAEIRRIVDVVKFDRERKEQGLAPSPHELHMIFTGNPGTGKTTVARLYGQILKSLHVLNGNNFVEVTGTQLLSAYVGDGAQRLREFVDQARGGVLFIDEAYAISGGTHKGTANEITAELLAAAENNRGELAIVLAGYASPMSKFLDINEGLRSRFRNPLLFPDMGTAQLLSAIQGIAKNSDFELTEPAIERLHSYIAAIPRVEGFGNVREMRKLFANIRENLARRHSADKSVSISVITEVDIPTLAPGKFDQVKYVESISRLNSMIGLKAVKESVEKVVSEAIVRKKIADEDAAGGTFSVGHFAFVGNPGTGKTTVANLLGEIFQSVGVLRNANVVVKNRSTLVAEYVGQTAPLVRAAVQQALDGILFIDEAYALVPQDSHRDFGPEAVATLVEEMEKYRGRLVVIMAGYPEDMERLIDSNVGLKSRVNHTVEFEDYTYEELREIAKYMTAAEPFFFDDEVLDLIAHRADLERADKNFANARTVRNLVEATISRFSVRAAQDAEVLSSRKVLTSDVADENVSDQVRFGFA